jgi:hypothetical protein
MKIEQYGQYTFIPPVEVGERQVDSLAELIAIALEGPDMSLSLHTAVTAHTAQGLEGIAELVPRVEAINMLLEGSGYKVTEW